MIEIIVCTKKILTAFIKRNYLSFSIISYTKGELTHAFQTYTKLGRFFSAENLLELNSALTKKSETNLLYFELSTTEYHLHFFTVCQNLKMSA